MHKFKDMEQEICE